MSTTWEEVRSLAADFQRAQLTTSVQRLSDRNCIEIVKKLVSLHLIDVVFTTSGKEYLTPQHLQREIKDELAVAGGRIDLSALATNLAIDINCIELAVKDFVKSEKSVTLIFNQLIADDYMDRIAIEINERLQQKGELSIGEIIKMYDVPADFLRSSILHRLGRIIKGQTDDKETFYTEAFVTMHRYRIRGVLCAVTRPLQLSLLMKNYCLPQQIMISVIERLIGQRKIIGTLSGTGEQRLFTPDIYSKKLETWVCNNFKQNGFLEYDAVRRLGISDPKQYIGTVLGDCKMIFLPSACIGEYFVDQVESTIMEASMTTSWVDVSPLIPSSLPAEDVAKVVQSVMKSNQSLLKTVTVIDDTLVASELLIGNCLDSLKEEVKQVAIRDFQTGVNRDFFLNKQEAPDDTHKKKKRNEPEQNAGREDDKKKKITSTKSGGGTQGREIKARANKKKYGKTKSNFNDSDDEAEPTSQSISKAKPQKLIYSSHSKIVDYLKNSKHLQQCPEALVSGIAEIIHPALNQCYEDELRTLHRESSVGSVTDRKKLFANLQEKINLSLTSIALCNEGLAVFEGELKTSLSQYLLRSLCSELLTDIVKYLMDDPGSETPQQLNSDQRAKLIKQLDSNVRDNLLNVNRTLTGQSVDEFLSEIQKVFDLQILDMKIRMDRKRDRQILSSYKMSLLQQLEGTEDPPLTLHLAVQILIFEETQKMAQFSGKFVPQMISFLRGKVTPVMSELLMSVQQFILKARSEETPTESEGEKATLLEKLQILKSEISNYKKK